MSGCDAARRWFVTSLPIALVTTPYAAHGQPRSRVRHVAWVGLGVVDPSHQTQLRTALRELGWVEGQSVSFTFMSAGGNTAKLAEMMNDVAGRGPDVIITSGTTAIRAAMAVTRSIPIVMAAGGDPVGAGLVASLQRPGGNVTGVSAIGQEMIEKNIEILKQIVSRLQTVTLIRAAANPANDVFLRWSEAVGTKLGLRVATLDLRDSDDFGDPFGRYRIEAGYLFLDPLFFVHRRRIAESAIRHKIPLTTSGREYAAAGFLFTYGPDYLGVVRLAATFVDRILRGANPAVLPVEQPTKVDFSVNLNTAEALGVTISPSLLLRADHIIK